MCIHPGRGGVVFERQISWPQDAGPANIASGGTRSFTKRASFVPSLQEGAEMGRSSDEDHRPAAKLLCAADRTAIRCDGKTSRLSRDRSDRTISSCLGRKTSCVSRLRAGIHRCGRQRRPTSLESFQASQRAHSTDLRSSSCAHCPESRDDHLRAESDGLASAEVRVKTAIP